MAILVGFRILPQRQVLPVTALQPWQFQPEAYGATGNGRVVSDVVTTINSAIITSATANWSAADANKKIMINGANSTQGTPLLTTIQSVQSPSQVTLAAQALQSATGCAAVWGTDDTAAINSAITAAGNYAKANNFLGEVLFGASIYIVAGAPTQLSSPAVFNTQLPLPYPAQSGAGQKLVIKLTGAGDAGQLQYFQSTIPNLQGTALVSMVLAPSTVDPTFGNQSVIGGPSGSSGFTGGFANLKAVISGISVWVPVLTNAWAYDLRYAAGIRLSGVSAQAFAPANQGTSPKLSDLPSLASFQGTHSRGIAVPVATNNDDVVIDSAAVEGFEVGISLQDHPAIARLATLYCDVGALVDLTGSPTNISHAVTIANWSCENYNGALRSNGGGGGICLVDITMDCEEPGGANPTYDVSDAGNTLYGQVLFTDPGRTTPQPVVSGAANLRIVNGRLGPGHWSGAPAVPASGTGQQNTAWRDAWLTITTGAGVTVSVIAIDGTTTGITIPASSSATVLVPGGKTITLTYAGGTPGWNWWLL